MSRNSRSGRRESMCRTASTGLEEAPTISTRPVARRRRPRRSSASSSSSTRNARSMMLDREARGLGLRHGDAHEGDVALTAGGERGAIAEQGGQALADIIDAMAGGRGVGLEAGSGIDDFDSEDAAPLLGAHGDFT